MSQKSNEFLETQPIGALMVKYAVPCVISLLVAALYNIADQIFIANADYLGSYGNAANTVVFPMTVVALAIAVMIGNGCCAFVSISLGANRRDAAHKGIGSAVLLCVAISLVLTAIYLLFQEPILTLFGGRVNVETFRQAKEYFFWITLGIPFYMFGQAVNPIIRSDGSPKFAMVATVAGQVLTVVMSVWYLRRMKAVQLERDSFHFYPALMKEYLPLGMTSFLSQISMVMAMAAIQNMLLKYGSLDPVLGQEQYAQIPMAVQGVVMKFFQIVISIAVGLAAEAVVGAVAVVIVELFPAQLIGIFGAANESAYYTEYGVKCFRTYLCLMVLATVNKGTFIYLQSLGKALLSTVLSLIREVVFGVGFALLLPVWFGLNGVLYSMPVSEALTFLIGLVIIIRTYRFLSDNPASAPQQTHGRG